LLFDCDEAGSAAYVEASKGSQNNTCFATSTPVPSFSCTWPWAAPQVAENRPHFTTQLHAVMMTPTMDRERGPTEPWRKKGCAFIDEMRMPYVRTGLLLPIRRRSLRSPPQCVVEALVIDDQIVEPVFMNYYCTASVIEEEHSLV